MNTIVVFLIATIIAGIVLWILATIFGESPSILKCFASAFLIELLRSFLIPLLLATLQVFIPSAEGAIKIIWTFIVPVLLIWILYVILSKIANFDETPAFLWAFAYILIRTLLF